MEHVVKDAKKCRLEDIFCTTIEPTDAPCGTGDPLLKFLEDTATGRTIECGHYTGNATNVPCPLAAGERKGLYTPDTIESTGKEEMPVCT